jgi:hypothetical protein
MSIVSTTTGTRWIGSTLEAFGREYLDKLAEQEVKVQNMSGAALSGLVVSVKCRCRRRSSTPISPKPNKKAHRWIGAGSNRS